MSAVPGSWRRRGVWVAAVTTAVLVAVTLSMWLVARGLARGALREQTAVLARQVGERIRRCVVTRVEMVVAMRHEWVLGGLHDDAGFTRRAEVLLATFPGYLAINRVDRDGNITFVYPLGPNRSALGRNLADTPPALATFREALVHDAPRLSPPVDLFQGGSGVTLYVPIGTDGALNGVFRTTTLIPACLGADELLEHAVALDDDGADVFTRRLTPADRDFEVHTRIALFNRTWGLRLGPAAAAVAAAERPAKLVLGIGLALSAVTAMLLVVLLRIKERARRHAAHVEHERERLAALADAANDLISIVDDDGRLHYQNRVAEELTGVGAEAVPLADLVVAEDRPALAAHAARCAATGRSITELRVRHPVTGTITPLEFHSFMLADRPGEPRLVATVGRDLRQRRQLESNLQQAQKLEVLGRLAGGVAHDFNNLLTVILSGIQLIDTTRPPDRVLLDELKQAVWRGAALTKELLALGRRSDAELARTDVADVVRGLAGLFRRLLPKSVELELRLPERPAAILGSVVQLEQIVINLVMNSVGAMPEGGRITVDVDAPADHVVLVVEDTGLGMQPEIVARVFEPFFTTKAPGEGTGLGLATVRNNVDRMRGVIDLDSTPGKGTRFTIRFPHERTLPPAEVAPLVTVAAPAKVVLLVDDEPQVRAALAHVLRVEGLEVLEAAHGRAAIDALESGARIDLVVSDVAMPVLGGLELARWVRDERPALPVILVSGNLQDENAVAELGVRFLPKPLALDVLRAAVSAATAHRLTG